MNGNLNTYKLIIAYDGTDYCGWIAQPGKQSISSILHETFQNTFKSQLSLIGASKTDAGVHALGQIARVKTSLSIEPQQLLYAWNNALPPSIVIKSLISISDDFHPRNNVQSKTYFYHFFLKRPLPFVYRYGWYFFYHLDLEKLKKCLQVFEGTHDFRAYCTGDEMTSTVRTIDEIKLTYNKQFGCYRISVRGKSFLRHMIRRIVGACMYVASHEDVPIDFLMTVMHNRDPNNILPTAPAHGLLLKRILYKL